MGDGKRHLGPCKVNRRGGGTGAGVFDSLPDGWTHWISAPMEPFILGRLIAAIHNDAGDAEEYAELFARAPDLLADNERLRERLDLLETIITVSDGPMSQAVLHTDPIQLIGCGPTAAAAGAQALERLCNDRKRLLEAITLRAQRDRLREAARVAHSLLSQYVGYGRPALEEEACRILSAALADTEGDG